MNIHSEDNKLWKKKFNPSWDNWSHCGTNCVGDHSSV